MGGVGRVEASPCRWPIEEPCLISESRVCSLLVPLTPGGSMRPTFGHHRSAGVDEVVSEYRLRNCWTLLTMVTHETKTSNPRVAVTMTSYKSRTPLPTSGRLLQP